MLNVGTIFGFDDFELDVRNHALRRAGVLLKTEALVLYLLEAFVRRPGQLISKDELSSLVWGDRIVSENALAVAMARLRQLLGEKHRRNRIIATVHRRGYRFVREVVTRDFSAFEAVSIAPPACARPFVGRAQEVSDLDAALGELHDQGRMIVVGGQAGVGKTRIAELLAAKASEANIGVTWCYCRELDELRALGLVSKLLRELLGPQLLSLRKDARFHALLPELWLLWPELGAGAQAPASRDDATPPNMSSKSRMFDAVTRALTLATQQKPHVVIVDDLHCADDASLELFEYLLPALPRTQLLLLATCRSHAGGVRRRLWRILGHRNSLRIDLSPLSEGQVARYLELAIGDVDPALGREVFRLSEGNPFYMIELGRQLRQTTSSAGQGPAALTIPDIAFELIGQRLAGLDDRAREVLSCAAVIGRKFSLPLLQAILGGSARDLIRSLDEIVARAVVRPAIDSRTDFVFAHELLRAALYEMLGPAERRAWHARAARALEQRSTLAREPIFDRAYHACNALPEGDLAKAVDRCIAAADAAAGAHATMDATHHLRQARVALELMPNVSPRLWGALLFRQAMILRGHSARELVPVAEQLLQLALEQGCDVELARASRLLDPRPTFSRPPILRDALSNALACLPDATSLAGSDDLAGADGGGRV